MNFIYLFSAMILANALSVLAFAQPPSCVEKAFIIRGGTQNERHQKLVQITRGRVSTIYFSEGKNEMGILIKGPGSEQTLPQMNFNFLKEWVESDWGENQIFDSSFDPETESTCFGIVDLDRKIPEIYPKKWENFFNNK